MKYYLWYCLAVVATGNLVAIGGTSTSGRKADMADNNAGMNILKNVTVTGYHTGIRVNEHTDGDYINLASDINGLDFAFAYHASRFSRVCAQRCTYPVAVTGKHGFSIDQLDIEIADITYWVVEGNVGAVEKFSCNGGASIRMRRIGAPASDKGK